MCTAISYNTKKHYFGRNLDIECSYGEKVIITPRNYRLAFRKKSAAEHHYAIIGIGISADNYPLYYDAVNEKGLAMAGLRFADAKYNEEACKKDNITTYELIPWILSQCENIDETKKLLDMINITNDAFSSELPPAPLHWIISDKSGSLTVECTDCGMKVYDNPYGVLTNMPSFEKQTFNLNNYINLSVNQPQNKFGRNIALSTYSRGMGAIGLPGDLSSMSRFVRAVFTKFNSVDTDDDRESIGQFFHILNSVYQTKGCTITEHGEHEYTLYSSCSDTDKGIYYYNTYTNSQISAVDMYKEDLDADELKEYEFTFKQNILFQN